MNNSSAKKQNRVLLVTLVVVLAAAAILIAVTGSANKKEKSENPPLDSNITETSSESGKTDKSSAESSKNAADDALGEKRADETDTVSDKANAAKDDKKSDEAVKNNSKDASAIDDAVEEVAAVQSGVLPSFSAPVDGLVLKGFSSEVPVFSYTMNDYRTHNGIDFSCSPGTPVYAAAEGVVCEVVDDPMMGVTVGISHSGGAVTRYRGMSEESMSLLSVGDNISKGQVIGASGSTALIESAEEDHLHFELEVNGVSEDPAEFMKVTYLSDLVED